MAVTTVLDADMEQLLTTLSEGYVLARDVRGKAEAEMEEARNGIVGLMEAEGMEKVTPGRFSLQIVRIKPRVAYEKVKAYMLGKGVNPALFEEAEERTVSGEWSVTLRVSVK